MKVWIVCISHNVEDTTPVKCFKKEGDAIAYCRKLEGMGVFEFCSVFPAMLG